MTLVLFVFQGLTAFLPTYLIEEKELGQARAVGLFARLSSGSRLPDLGVLTPAVLVFLFVS